MAIKARISAFSFWLSAVLYILQYGRAIGIAPLYDDWRLIADADHCMTGFSTLRGLWNFFEAPLFTMWRPLHVMHFALADGDSLVWVQAVKLAAVILCGLCFVWSARAIGLTHAASNFAGAAFFLHQSQILGGEPDLMGDVIVTLSVILSVGLAGQYEQGKLRAMTYAVLAGLLTAFACLGKEAGVVIPLVPIAAWIILKRGDSVSRGHLYAFTAGSIVLSAYLVVRTFTLMLPLSDSNLAWSFHFGGNIPYNLALIGGALLCPVSTIQLFMHSAGWMFLGAVLTAIGAGLLIWGVVMFRKEENVKWVLWLLALFVLVQGPVLLFEHTNERNLSRSLPLGILLCAFAASALWKHARPRMRLTLAAFFGLWIVLSQAAMNDKVEGILRMHARGSGFLDHVERLMPVPPDREVLFACESAPKGYSEYDQPFWVFMPGTSDLGLQYRYRNPSFQSDFVVVASRSDAPDADFWVAADGSVSKPH